MLNKLIQYLGEFRINFRPIAAAAAGMGGGPAFMNYSIGAFLPHLVKEFGWARADLALMGSVGIVTLICVPIAGRMADIFGVRWTAILGIMGVPACAVAFSMMDGSIGQFFVLYFLANILGSAATSAVYTRLIATRFDKARGLALALVIAAPAAVSAIGLPIVTEIIAEDGWRAAFQSVAIFLGVVGACVLVLIPRHRPEETRQGGLSAKATWEDYKLILTSLPFWFIFAGMFLCNIPAGIQLNQLPLVMTTKGITAETAALIFSTYLTGTIIGRFLCGISLDHFKPYFVAAVAMFVPAIGFFMLLTDNLSITTAYIAVGVMGLSQGAEGDLMGYLVSRYLKLELYSSSFGLMYCAVGGASLVGAFLAQSMMQGTDNYNPFLLLSGIGVVLGAASFLLLWRTPMFPRNVQVQQAA